MWGREANSTLSVEEVLRRAAELTKRLIDYQIFSILLYDESDNVFRHRVTVKFGQRVAGEVCGAGAQRNYWCGGVVEAAGGGAGCDARSAVFADQSGDAVGAGGADVDQGSSGGRDGFGKPAAQLLHAGPCAGAFDFGGDAGGVHRERASCTSRWRGTKRAWSAT